MAEFKPGDRVRIKGNTSPGHRTWSGVSLPTGGVTLPVEAELAVVEMCTDFLGYVRFTHPALAGSWLIWADLVEPVEQELCHCPATVLIAQGCQCGGR